MEHSRYDNSYYEGLVEKMLSCGNPEEMGHREYLCESCGVGRRLVSMSCKSTLCLRCGKVYVDNWVSQVSKMLHAGGIYRHIVLTMPDNLRLVFYKYSVELLVSDKFSLIAQPPIRHYIWGCIVYDEFLEGKRFVSAHEK